MMSRTFAARPLRFVLAACLVGVTFAVVVGSVGLLGTTAGGMLLMPFVAAAISVAGLAIALPHIDRLIQGVIHRSTTTPYAALASAAAGIQAGSVEHALPNLAKALAEGTQAQYAVVWLAVDDKLVSAASHPVVAGAERRTIANLAALLAQPDVGHVVPILDGSTLRAALSISKPGLSVTHADRQLLQDVANGAGLLLRGAQLNAELKEQVRQADELAAELQASRQRLTRARDVERQRLAAELTNVTTGRLASLRSDVINATRLLSDEIPLVERAMHTVSQARHGLDELLERFRVIVRGVYPAVLRDQGPDGALDEVAADLPRPVRLSGKLSRRLAWEVESGIYYLTASAMQHLASRPAEQPLHVHLEHTNGRLAVRIHDPASTASATEVLAVLTVDVDRLEALGGNVEITEQEVGNFTLYAWLPDQLEPLVDHHPKLRPHLLPSARDLP
jgi:signal transduction histidine kinase